MAAQEGDVEKRRVAAALGDKAVCNLRADVDTVVCGEDPNACQGAPTFPEWIQVYILHDKPPAGKW